MSSMTTRDSAPAAGDGAAQAMFERMQDLALAETGVVTTSRFVDLEAPRLRVQLLEAGTGDPVLMIHGGNSVAASWAPLLPHVGSRFRLLMPDRPGCGLTSRFDYGGVSLRHHAVEFVTGLLNALGHERVALAGSSMGGFFALAFAIAHPDRVSKLALLGEPAGASARPAVFHRLTGTRGINTLLYSTALRPAGDAAAARAGLTRSRIVAHPDRVPDSLLACLAAGAQLPGAIRSWTTMVEQAFDPAGLGLFAKHVTVTHALIPDLPTIQAPTLFLWGDQDPFGTPDVGRALVERIPHARLQVVADAGHLVWVDRPELCGDALTAFLAE